MLIAGYCNCAAERREVAVVAVDTRQGRHPGCVQDNCVPDFISPGGWIDVIIHSFISLWVANSKEHSAMMPPIASNGIADGILQVVPA